MWEPRCSRDRFYNGLGTFIYGYWGISALVLAYFSYGFSFAIFVFRDVTFSCAYIAGCLKFKNVKLHCENIMKTKAPRGSKLESFQKSCKNSYKSYYFLHAISLPRKINFSLGESWFFDVVNSHAESSMFYSCFCMIFG